MSDRYVRGWRQAWLGWGVLTLSVATVMWSFSGVAFLLVALTVLCTLALALARSGMGQDQAALSPRRLLADGGRWGVLAVAVLVTGMVQVGLTFLVPTAIVLSSPSVVGRLLHAVRGSRLRPGPQGVEAVLRELDLGRAREVVARLDLAGLCWAWSRSAGLLLEVPQAHHRAAVVALRELYLDEMERRDPAGFAAWLESGVDLALPPDRFLVARRGDGGGRGLAA